MPRGKSPSVRPRCCQEGGLCTVEGFAVVFFCEKRAVFGFYRVWQKIPTPPSEREMAIIGFEKGWFAEP